MNKANVYRTRSPDRGTKSMPSPPSPIEIRAEHHFRVAVFQRFTVAMFQPVLADLPVADRQPTGAKGTHNLSTLYRLIRKLHDLFCVHQLHQSFKTIDLAVADLGGGEHHNDFCRDR